MADGHQGLTLALVLSAVAFVARAARGDHVRAPPTRSCSLALVAGELRGRRLRRHQDRRARSSTTSCSGSRPSASCSGSRSARPVSTSSAHDSSGRRGRAATRVAVVVACSSPCAPARSARCRATPGCINENLDVPNNRALFGYVPTKQLLAATEPGRTVVLRNDSATAWEVLGADALMLEQHGRHVQIVETPGDPPARSTTRCWCAPCRPAPTSCRSATVPIRTSVRARRSSRSRASGASCASRRAERGDVCPARRRRDRRACAVAAEPRSWTRPRSSSSSRSVWCCVRGDSGFNGLSYDESFTAMAARLPLDQLFDYLRTQDTHPPFDYLLRAPFARAGASDVVLRLPSFVCSVGALVLFAWWMRARGSPASSPPRCSPAARSRSSTAVRRGCTHCSSCSASRRRCSPNGGWATTRRAGARGLRAASSRWPCSTT